MAVVGSSSFTISDLPSDQGGLAARPTVVWLSGEHDASTDGALCLTLARAIAFDPSGLVLDLSEVTFMSSSTLGVILRAREYLRQHSAPLTVRSPSASVRILIGACDSYDLFDDTLEASPEGADLPPGEALGSWVAVPVAERAGAQPGSPAPMLRSIPRSPAPTMALSGQGRSADQGAEESMTKVALHGRP